MFNIKIIKDGDDATLQTYDRRDGQIINEIL